MVARVPPAVRLVMVLCRDCALRAVTACTLTPAQIDPVTWQIRRRSKNGRSISVPTTLRVREILRFAVQQCEPDQFLTQALGCRSDTGADVYTHVRRSILNAKRALNIRGNWTLHDLRRTAARQLYDRTHDLRLVQALLGHAHLAYTLWYLNDPTTELSPELMEHDYVREA